MTEPSAMRLHNGDQIPVGCSILGEVGSGLAEIVASLIVFFLFMFTSAMIDCSTEKLTCTCVEVYGCFLPGWRAKTHRRIPRYETINVPLIASTLEAFAQSVAFITTGCRKLPTIHRMLSLHRMPSILLATCCCFKVIGAHLQTYDA